MDSVVLLQNALQMRGRNGMSDFSMISTSIIGIIVAIGFVIALWKGCE